jgi:uncharacterized membrane protein
VDRDALEQIIRDARAPLHVLFDNRARPAEALDTDDPEAETDRAAIERRVFAGLFSANPDYRDHAEGWTRLATEIKEMTRTSGFDPAQVVASIAHHTGALAGKEAPAHAY